MTRRRPRALRPEEERLWRKVAGSATPLHPEPPAAPETPPDTPPDAPAPAAAPVTPFGLGELVPERSGASVDPAPDPGVRLAASPLRMDRKTHTRLTRGKLVPEGRLDLHGMKLAEAHPALLAYVGRAHAEGKRLILVITGKGRASRDDGPVPTRRGILRHQVPRWLAAPPLAALVQQVVPAHQSHGGTGAYYVYLRRAR